MFLAASPLLVKLQNCLVLSSAVIFVFVGVGVFYSVANKLLIWYY